MAHLDAEKLHQAVSKDDKKTIIDILVKHNHEQRIAIAKKYKEFYAKKLDEAIRLSVLVGSVPSHSGLLERNFRQTVAALIKTPLGLDVDELYNAMKGAGTDEATLIEILCTKDPAEIEQIKDAYKLKHKTDLEKDIHDDTSGYFRRVLLEVVKAKRSGPGNTTPKQDARNLYQAGERQLGTDENALIDILTSRTLPWIREIYMEYSKISERNLCDALRSELSGNLRKSLQAIVMSACCPSTYFAGRIRSCLKGLGTRDRALIRLIVSRSHIDLPQVVEAYQKSRGNSLIDDVKSDTSGDYRDLLVAIIQAHSKK